MIQFKMNEIPDQVAAFQGRLAKCKRQAPPGRWLPRFFVRVETEQEEETEQWVAFVSWELFDSSGKFPCRSTAKHETISVMDPPDRFPGEPAAEAFGRECAQDLREQFKPWITTTDFAGGSDEI